MEEISVDEIRKRADELIEEWKDNRRVKGLGPGVELTTIVIASAALPFIYHILGIIHHAWDIRRHAKNARAVREKDVMKMVKLWIEESIEDIAVLTG